jgi:hypothetical protein
MKCSDWLYTGVLIVNTNHANHLFFTLLIRSAYKLGNLLREDPTTDGLLYAIGLFLPIQNLWTFKIYYDSRFYICQNDYFHGCYELAVLLALASAVFYIRPVNVLANYNHQDHPPAMFRFSLSMLVAYVLALGRHLEVAVVQRYMKCQRGLFPEAFAATMMDAIDFILSIAFLLAATIYSGIQSYRSDDDGSMSSVMDGEEQVDHRWLAETTTDATLNDTTTADTTSYHHQQQDHVAIWLLLGSTLICFVSNWVLFHYFGCFKVDHKTYVFAVVSRRIASH